MDIGDWLDRNLPKIGWTAKQIAWRTGCFVLGLVIGLSV